MYILDIPVKNNGLLNPKPCSKLLKFCFKFTLSVDDLKRPDPKEVK